MQELEVELTDEQLEALVKKRNEQKREQAARKRKEYETLREEIVIGAVNSALHLAHIQKAGHREIIGDLLSFRELMIEAGELPKNSIGGFSLKNEADTMKVSLKIQNIGEFDERADIAEAHIKDFFERTLKQADPNTFDMMMSLLERKKGKLEYSRVMKILKFEDRYDDEAWKKGCQLLKDSYRNVDTKPYLDFAVKDEHGVWQPVNLNFASYDYDIDVKIKKEEKA